MAKALCLLHANCQGDALLPLLENSPAFARAFTVRRYVNYTRQEIAEADIENCQLFLYQHLKERWGAFSSQEMLPRLPANCCAVELPNLFFKGYWPFWTNAVPINFGDNLLETLLAKGLSSREALKLYLRGDPALLGDVAAVAEASLAQQDEKETHCPVRCVPLLRERWRDEQLFITINHPGSTLLFHLADGLLRLLGLGTLTKQTRASYIHPQNDFWLPLHPALGHLLQLPFATRERRYPIFGANLTHQEYISAYLACREHKVDDLIGFLRTLPANSAKTETA